jgi:hypothetical protein
VFNLPSAEIGSFGARVTNHAFDFAVVHDAQYAHREGHRQVLRVASGSEGIRLAETLHNGRYAAENFRVPVSATGLAS